MSEANRWRSCGGARGDAAEQNKAKKGNGIKVNGRAVD
jgi:hypothetical protein